MAIRPSVETLFSIRVRGRVSLKSTLALSARYDGFERWSFLFLTPKCNLIAVDPRSVDPRIRDAKAHLERELLTRLRAYTTWRVRGGGFLKGIPQGERRSVACFDDLEEVR